jgi:AcrR family transcriptional regulator
MAKKAVTRFSPRKKPLQERSTATVDAIVQAAAYILQRKGWERFNTNAVAEKAGVNIASLYQYFPNKEAIVAELKRRHSADVDRAIGAVLEPGMARSSPTEALRRIIVATVREHSVDPGLDRLLEDELPLSVRRTKGDPPRWADEARSLAAGHPRPEVALFVARCAVHAVVHEASREHPDLLRGDVLAEELMTLLAPYLRLGKRGGQRAKLGGPRPKSACGGARE